MKPHELAELWDNLHYPGRRRTLRNFACHLGLHHPIVFTDLSGSYEPPDYGWMCDRCGLERLPYLARFWGRSWFPRRLVP